VIIIKKYFILVLSMVFLLLTCLSLYKFKDSIKIQEKTKISRDIDMKENNNEDFSINGIKYLTTYEELFNILGKPQKITDIEDKYETLYREQGYFSVLSYPGLEITLKCLGDNFNLEKGKVVEIDITDSNIKTMRQISINDTKEKVMKVYNIREVFNADNDIIDYKIHGLKINKFSNYLNYDEYCYIKKSDEALIFLFKDNKVSRIVLREFRDNSEDFVINRIKLFSTTYEELINILGKPRKITKLENAIPNQGYFSVLSYPELEITLKCLGDNFNLEKGKVVEIDITDSNIKTMRQISINDTKEKVMKVYNIQKSKKYTIEDREGGMVGSRIHGLKTYKFGYYLDYDEYCYILKVDVPIALIFLFENNKVSRILLRHLSSG